MDKNIIIPKPDELKKKKEAIREQGVGRFYVLADFDKTLTKAYVNGKEFVSLMSILRDGNYLAGDYAARAYALYNKYHPIEIDPKILLEEKKLVMHEWWTAHFKLLVESGLNKKIVREAIGSGKAELREGTKEFIEILSAHNIPLVILSSSGLGADAISMYLEREGVLRDNIYIVSNVYEWDESGNATGVKQPIIHSFNKSASAIRDFPFYGKINDRKNVLLLGNSPEDADIIQKPGYDNLIKIGFLNERVDENLERYKKNYDAVVLNDPSMEYINGLLKEIAE